MKIVISACVVLGELWMQILANNMNYNKQLSIVIPYCYEYPDLYYTIRAVMIQLEGKLEYEIILVDNNIEEKERHTKNLEKIFKDDNRFKFIHYSNKLSHSNSLRVGIDKAEADIIFQLDAHVLFEDEAIISMYNDYTKRDINTCSMNLLQDMKLRKNNHEWIFAPNFNFDSDNAWYGWKYLDIEEFNISHPFRAPACSACGLMVSKHLIKNILKNYPKEIGNYYGEEQFFAFSMAVLGKNILYYPKKLYHFSLTKYYAPRKRDIMNNTAIGIFIATGERHLKNFLFSQKIKHKKDMRKEIINAEENIKHRQHIEKQQVWDLDEWLIKKGFENYDKYKENLKEYII